MQPTDPKSPPVRQPRVAGFISSVPRSTWLKILGGIGLGAIAVAISLQKPVIQIVTQIIAETTQSPDGIELPTDASAAAIAAARSRKIAAMTEKFKVADIAGKSPEEVKAILGKPMFSSAVSPSLAPCPCEQKNYQHGLVEIIYIHGKADWITINLPKDKVDTVGSYMATQVFKNPDFVSIKVATN